MGYINNTQIIIKKSNEDILNFYQSKDSVYLREFINKKGWKDEVEVIGNVLRNEYDINIDSDDKIYGIVKNNQDEVLYLYTDENLKLKNKLLFKYEASTFNIQNLKINKSENTIHIVYYISEVSDNKNWGIVNNYYDGENWYQNNIDTVVAMPVLNPFIMVNKESTDIFYFKRIDNEQEICISRFNAKENSWDEPVNLTSSSAKKINMDVLRIKDDFHITWCEFEEANLVVKYLKVTSAENELLKSDEVKISAPSNCSNPVILEFNNVLWISWIQMDKLYSAYSKDNGKTWSDIEEIEETIENKFIKYRYESNNSGDKSVKLNNVYGTYYPRISFIGFKDIQIESKN